MAGQKQSGNSFLNSFISTAKSLAWFVIFLIMAGPVFSQPDVNFKQAGLNHLRKGEYIEALENLNKAIQREPGMAELYFLRGFAKYGLDDYLGAELDYTRSINISPALADVFVNRGIVRSIQQNFNGAFEDFKRAEEINPQNAEIYVSRARANLFLKNYYSCIVDCRRAIELKYRHESIYILMGSSELGIKRYENAIEDFSRAVEINPADPNSYIQLGVARMELNQYDSAIHCFSRALAVDSNNTFALFNRSLALVKTENQAGALDDLNRLISISPYNSYAWFNRAILLINVKDKKGAIRDLGTVITLNPNNIISYYYRGLLKTEVNDDAGALADFNKTIELYPDYTNAWYSRHEVKLRLKDRSGAMADYQRAMELAAKNHVDPAALMAQKNYLESLVKLTGDFEEMNTINSKFQNQYIDIQLIPMFSVFIGKLNFDQISLYDTYGKPYYHSNIITLTNHAELIPDSVWMREIVNQTSRIDTLPGEPAAYYRRAIAHAALRNFSAAFADYDSALILDPAFLMCYFSRAITRYDHIQLIRAEDDSRQEAYIASGQPMTKGQISVPGDSASGDEATSSDTAYQQVIRDLDKVLELDPGFAYAWFNRGYVNCKTGNYADASGDFTSAIEKKDQFAEARFNRGLIFLLLNDKTKGCEDLSKAGELGIADAYRVMKRYCFK